jgi:hypothetical protein
MSSRGKFALAAVAALLLAACGAGTARQASDAVHTARPGEPALIQVSGYRYTDLTTEDNQAYIDARTLMVSVNDTFPGMVTATSVHWVRKDANDKILLLQMDVSARYANDPVFRSNEVPGMTRGMAGAGATVVHRTVRTEQVTVATGQEQGRIATVYGWFHDGIFTMVLAENAVRASDAYVDAYLAQAHA